MTPEVRAFAYLQRLDITDDDTDPEVGRLAAAIREAVAEEREACARVAQEFTRPHRCDDSRGIQPPLRDDIAAAIRARSLDAAPSPERQ